MSDDNQRSASETERAPKVTKVESFGPGLLGVLAPVHPELGLDAVNTVRANMVRLLADRGAGADDLPPDLRPGPALDSIPDEEREALLLSLATTICRAEYHEQRFWKIVDHLLARRRTIAEPLFWEAFVHSAVFEGAAALGAARTIVDEVIHIAARRHGHARWEASDAVRHRKPAMDVPEVHCLREREQWFDQLNKYRNVLYHRGWRGDAGAYFPPDAPEPEARDPDRNPLLVPDLASLREDARAHAWIYTDNFHLEPLVRSSLDGMREFVDAICTSAWQGQLPKPGTTPASEQVNMMVVFPRPAPFARGDAILLPVFSTEALAKNFTGYPPGAVLTLSSLPLLRFHFPEPAFALCAAGLEAHLTEGTGLVIVVDPVDPAMTQRRHAIPVPEGSLRNRPFDDPVGIPRESLGVERLLCWQATS